MSALYRVVSRRSIAMIAMVALFMLSLVPQRAHSNEAINEPFADYYWQHHGSQVLGAVNSAPQELNGYQVQYFEKGRLEDHRHESGDPNSGVHYSRLTIELMEMAPYLPIDGMPITYGELWERSEQKHGVPEGFVSGTMPLPQGVFVPSNAQLQAAPGYIVPYQFWTYINRRSFFPNGWLQDVGMPLTNAFDILVTNPDGSSTRLVMQAFERTILTLDLAKVFEWPVQRVNVGTDALWARGQEPLVQPPAAPTRAAAAGAKRIEVSLERQWLYAYEGDTLVMDAPVSTGKDGFNTPTGRFAVYSKIASKTLRGRAGGESWNVPDVPYIMFYQRDIAIHGVYWHDRFGTGERHSHGCVGLAPYDAGALYAWAPNGTPVIVY